jgi:hypothetical protein
LTRSGDESPIIRTGIATNFHRLKLILKILRLQIGSLVVLAGGSRIRPPRPVT